MRAARIRPYLAGMVPQVQRREPKLKAHSGRNLAFLVDISQPSEAVEAANASFRSGHPRWAV